MTEQEFKALVKEVLAENPVELTRQQRIDRDRKQLDDYVRQISARPDSSRSPIDSEAAPVKQTDTALPIQQVFYNDPPPGNAPDGSPVDSDGYWLSVFMCASEGGSQLVQVRVRDIPE